MLPVGENRPPEVKNFSLLDNDRPGFEHSFIGLKRPLRSGHGRTTSTGVPSSPNLDKHNSGTALALPPSSHVDVLSAQQACAGARPHPLLAPCSGQCRANHRPGPVHFHTEGGMASSHEALVPQEAASADSSCLNDKVHHSVFGAP